MAAAADGAPSQGVIEKVADSPSDYGSHMSEPDDTSEVGRVKTDKTVRTVGFDKIHREDGSVEGEQEIGDNFTVTFSALSSGGKIEGESTVPVDMVFVLDFSSSMRTNAVGPISRAAAMVDATNDAIAALMARNPLNRVSVVTFGTDSDVLIPMQSLTPDANGHYLAISQRTTGNATVSPAKAYAGSTSIAVNGTTNMQAGIYEGMQQFLSVDPQDDVDGADQYRVPGVMILSDGFATRTMKDANWWAPTDRSTNGSINESNTNIRYWGSGYLAMLEASYLKERVSAYYGGTSCYIGTAGIGIPNSQQGQFGEAILDPSGKLDGAVFPAGSSTNVLEEIRTHFDTYLSQGKPDSLVPIANGTNQTVNSPEQYRPTSLKYNDAYTNANSSDELVATFLGAVEHLTTQANAPTNVVKEDSRGETTGHITFTDTIGELMEVKDVHSILWVDHKQDSPTYGQDIEYERNDDPIVEGNKTTYVFEYPVHSSWLYEYEDTNLSNIIIEVVRNEDGQDTITIKIPPALLPMVDYQVHKDLNGVVTSSERNEATRPIKINYIVGPKEGVIDQIRGEADVADATLKAQIDAYVADSSHTVELADGSRGVALYTNAFGSTTDVPVAEFGIADSNTYYSFGSRTPLYLDEACTQPATGYVAGTTYYYEHDIYLVGSTGADAVQTEHAHVSSLSLGDVAVIDGQLYAMKGAPKDLPDTTYKDAQDTSFGGPTDTEAYQLASQWSNGSRVRQYQGNNGRLVVQGPGNLQLEEIITYTDFMDGNSLKNGVVINEEEMDSKEFEFTLTLEKSESDPTPLAGSYAYTIMRNGSEHATGTIASGDTVKLTRHDVLLIKNIPAGTKYTIKQTASNPGYTLTGSETTYQDGGSDSLAETTVAGDLANQGRVSGIITSSYTSQAEFTNNYAITDAGKAVVQQEPKVRKVFVTGERGWLAADTFDFIASVGDNNPDDTQIQPTQVTVADEHISSTDSGTHIAEHKFDGVTLDKPGTYTFRIREKVPSHGDADYIDGVSYTNAVWTYTIVVADNGDGTLSYSTSMTDPSGAEVADGYAEFTNSYSEQEVTVSTMGVKVYTDTTSSKPLEASMFTFELRPNWRDGHYTTDGEIDAVPMPSGTTGSGQARKAVVGNTVPSGDFNFGDITVSQSDMAGATDNGDGTRTKSFYYIVQEEEPGVDNADAKIPGMTYDLTRHPIELRVTDTGSTLNAEVIFTTQESVDRGEVVVRNTYEPAPAVTVDPTADGVDDDDPNVLAVTKLFQGRDLRDGEQFSFTIEPTGPNARAGVQNGTIEMGSATATVGASDFEDGSATAYFEGIGFKRVGSYTFTITEQPTGNSAISSSPASVTAVVVVTDGGNGSLQIDSVTFPQGDTFTNTYTARSVNFGDMGAVQIEKKLTGRDMQAGEFNFAITAADENAQAKSGTEAIQLANASGAADGVERGTQALTGLTFTQDDVGKTFTYTIEEVPNTPARGVTFASDGKQSQTVTFEVADDGSGTLSVVASCEGESVTSTAASPQALEVHFQNSYEPEPIDYSLGSFTKLIDGRDWAQGDVFTFQITGSEGAPLPEPATATVSAEDIGEGEDEGHFTFGQIHFERPGTYTYTIAETSEERGGLVNDVARTITVRVTDDGSGHLVATTNALGDAFVFANTYRASVDYAGVNVAKTLHGRAMREREFMVDVRPVDTLDASGDPSEGYATADEAQAVFGVKKTGETIVLDRAEEGVASVTNVIGGLALTEADAGKTYAFEVKEFKPSYAEEAELDGATYLMRDGIYYNTLGQGFDHWRVEIAVADDNAGHITTTTTWIAHNEDHETIATVEGGSSANAAEAPTLRFDNTYKATGQATINAIKDLEGRAWTDDDAFQFSIERMQLNDEGTALVEYAGDGSDVPLPSGTLTAKHDTDMVGSDGQQHQAVNNPDAEFSNDYVNGWQINLTESDLALDESDNIMKADFYYKITEVTPEDDDPDTDGVQKAGVTYSQTPRYVHVHAQDTRTGTITTTVEYVNADAPNVSLGATPVFTNRYNPSGELQIPVAKVLENRTSWTDADAYTFTLTALNTSYPMPDEQGRTLVINKDTENHAGRFGAITFTAPGTYNYLVRETVPSDAHKVAGVEYDSSPERRVRVVVADGGDGTLSIGSITYYTDAAYTVLQSDQDKAVFTNAYKATSGVIDTNKGADGTAGTGIFSTTKQLSGRAFRTGDSFSFAITGPAGAPLPSEASVDIAPTASASETTFGFGTIEFTQEHLHLSPITYTITETSESGAGITVDAHEERITVTLTDDGRGGITVSASPSNEGSGDTSEDEVLFVNTYAATGSVDVRAIKDLIGRPWTADDSFNFAIEPQVLVPAHDDVPSALRDATATEADVYPMPQASTAAARVTDNPRKDKVADGQWFAKPAWTIDFDISDLTSYANGRKVGDFFYKITEAVPAEGSRLAGVDYSTATAHTAHVHVEDNGVGGLSAVVYYDETTPGDISTAAGATPVLENHYTAPTDSLRVTKTWDGDNNDTYGWRTDVTMHLYRIDADTGSLVQAGVEPKTIAKNANPAEATWADLPVTEWYTDEDGLGHERPIRYVVLEESVAGYATTYSYGATTGSSERIPVTLDGDTAAAVQTLGVDNTLDTATTHETSLAGRKVWADNNNADGVRPAVVTLELLADGEPTGDTTQAAAVGNWEWSFEHLPAYDAQGQPIAYTVRERVVAGYTALELMGGRVIVNTLRTTSATVQKAWNDANNQDGVRPDRVVFHLMRTVGQDTTEVRAVELTGPTNTANAVWRTTVDGLPAFVDGVEARYWWREDVPAGYTADGAGDGANEVSSGGLITNTHIPTTRDVSVAKVWRDDNNRDGLRAPVTLSLYANGAPALDAAGQAISVVLDGTENTPWTHTFTGLPTNANGRAITYTVVETSMPSGYSVSYSTTADGTLVATNVHEPERMSVFGSKTWHDDASEDERGTLNVRLQKRTADEQGNESWALVDTLGVNYADNGWDFVFKNVYRYEGGKEIDYRVVEVTPDGYVASIWQDDVDGTWSIVNTSTTSVSGRKLWADGADAVEHDPVVVTLKANGRAATHADGSPVANELTASDGSFAFANLPAYDENGARIAYTVEELQVPAGYSAKVEGTTITNTRIGTTGVTATKMWDDNDNQDGLRTDVTLHLDRVDGTTVTRDVAAEQTIAASARGDALSASWQNLAAYDQNGYEIVYQVRETGTPAGYTSSVQQTQDGSFVVTNTHKPETIDVTLVARWDDFDNQDGIRPSAAAWHTSAHLMNGTSEVAASSRTVARDADGNYVVTWHGVNRYEAGGSEVAYTVSQDAIEGYNENASGVAQTIKADGSASDGFTLVNVHEAETVSVGGSKTWNDNNNQDGNRPASITVNLIADGVRIDSKTVTAQDGWSFAFDDLPAKHAGRDVLYTVTESPVANYTPSVSEQDDGSFAITNTHAPGKTSVSVSKVWDDEDNFDGTRPSSATVTLLANGQATGQTAVLSAANKWTYTFTGLDLMSAGSLIAYTVIEAESDIPEGYTADVSGNAEEGFTVTNTHVPEKTEVIATKVWQDNVVTRRANVTLHLWRHVGDEEPQLVEGDDMIIARDAEIPTVVWRDLPVRHDNDEVTYSVTEEPVVGYEGAVHVDEEDGIWTFTNTRTELTSFTATKVWVGGPAQKPDVTLHLWRAVEGAEAVEVVGAERVVSSGVSTQAEVTWDNLPAYDDKGEPYVYSVTEDSVANYNCRVIAGSVVVNTFTPTARVSVEKVWDDNDDADGLRPEGVTVHLLKQVGDNPAHYDTLEDRTISGDAQPGEEAVVWEGLPLYEGGLPIAYSVSEDQAFGYDQPVVDELSEGTGKFRITNTRSESISIDVTKTWLDNNNQDGLRGALTLHLDKQVGGVYSRDAAEPITVSEQEATADSFTRSWADLPTYEDGQPIAYTVREDAIEGYDAYVSGDMANGFTVTNVHGVEVTSARVMKHFEDDDDREGLRPDSVKVVLVKTVGGRTEEVADVAPIVLSELNNWAYTVNGLPSHEGGQEVSYGFVENGVAEGYAVSYTDADGQPVEHVAPAGGTVMNTHEPGSISVRVTKAWNDDNNRDGLRSDVTLDLVGTTSSYVLELGQRTIAADAQGDAATAVWEGLATHMNGEKITYTVSERAIAGYASSVSAPVVDAEGNIAVTVTNTHVPETGEVTATKAWVDANNQDGLRVPVTLELWRRVGTGALEFTGERKTVDPTGEQSIVWAGLPTHEDGTAIAYLVVEPDVPEGYNSTVSRAADGAFTVTNTHAPAHMSVTAEKTWANDAGAESNRPAFVTLRLFKVNDGVETPVASGRVWSSATGEDARVVWSNLPTHENGVALDFVVREDVPGSYTASVSQPQVDAEGNLVFKVTNSFDAVSVTGTKTWADDGRTHDNAAEVSLELTRESAATAAPEPVAATPVWGGDVYTFATLPARDSYGNQYHYHVAEAPVEGYATTYDGYDITNTATSLGSTQVSVIKRWDDDNNNDASRPAGVTVRLLGNGTEVAHAQLTEAGNWSHVFKGLPTVADGASIEYMLTEDPVEGYVVQPVQGDAEEGFVVTNARVSGQTSVVATKVWNDGESGSPEQHVPVVLHLVGQADGWSHDFGTRTIDLGSTRATWANVPTHYKGAQITYSVEEEDVPGYESAVVRNADGSFTVTNTHTRPEEQRSVSVVKRWDDANDQDGLRPDAVTIRLVAGEEKVDTCQLSATNGWAHTFEGLPTRDEDGATISYTVEEEVPTGYACTGPSGTGNSEDPFVVVNVHEPATYGDPDGTQDPANPGFAGIAASKVWNDDNDALGLRQDAKLRLVGSVDGHVVYVGDAKTVPAGADVAAAVGWTGAPVKWDGQEVAYTVEEEAQFGYTTAVSGDVTTGFVVTNTIVATSDTVEVSKEWDDANNQDGMRPQSVVANLVQKVGVGRGATVKAYASATLSADNNWSCTWTDLPFEVQGEDGSVVPVTYTVTEDAVAGYDACISATSEPGVFKIVNRHVPQTYGAPDGPTDPANPAFDGIRAAKVWADDNNAAGNRPGFVVLRLVGTDAAGNQVYNQPQVVAGDATTVGWTGVPKYAAGQEVSYTVAEDATASYYTASAAIGSVAEGFTITNTYNANVNVAVRKAWLASDGTAIEVAPAAITLHLMKRIEGFGEAEVATRTIEAGASGDALTVDFGQLPAFEGGKPVVYFVVEDEVAGYTASVGDGVRDGLTLTLPLTNTASSAPDDPDDPEKPTLQVMLASFVDYLNAAGEQVVKYVSATAQDLANFDTLKPADPDHAAEGYLFQQWDRNDSTVALEDGTTVSQVTYVARYQATSATAEQTVIYLDPQAETADRALLSSTKTADPDSVEPYDASGLKHKNLQFVGWQRVVDAAGNVVFAAKYAADCANPSSGDSGDGQGDKEPSSEEPSSKDPQTPDPGSGGTDGAGQDGSGKGGTGQNSSGGTSATTTLRPGSASASGNAATQAAAPSAPARTSTPSTADVSRVALPALGIMAVASLCVGAVAFRRQRA